MIKSHLKHLTVLGCFVLLATLALAGSVAAQKDSVARDSILPIRLSSDGTGPSAPSSGVNLARNNNGVFFNLYNQGLTPGNVYSIWMVVFNNPQFCATSPCTPSDLMNPFVDGTPMHNGARIVGLDGAATFGGYRAVGDATGGIGGTQNGILLPLSSEIHFALVNHGVASMDPVILEAQLTTRHGGCTPTCPIQRSAIFQR